MEREQIGARNRVSNTETLLKDIRPNLSRAARRYAGGRRTLWEELLQEGMIKSWLAIDSYNPSSDFTLESHLVNYGIFRIQKVFTRGDVFGRPENRGVKRPAEVARPDYELERPHTPALPIAAYHSREIWQAVKDEAPGMVEDIYRKFWLDEPVKLKTQWYTPGGVRDRLATRLQHLRELV